MDPSEKRNLLQLRVDTMSRYFHLLASTWPSLNLTYDLLMLVKFFAKNVQYRTANS
jgi:hypothetical protein